MRLGQLARQLEIKPDKIVVFLEKEKNITIKSHPNSKVEDDLIEVITSQFSPIIKVAMKVEKEKNVVNQTIEEVLLDVTPKPVEHIDTVKAIPAQELKIIGKIDLPNKKEIQVEVDGVVYDQETLNEKKKADQKADREIKSIEKEAKRKEEEEKKKVAREKREVEAERQAMLKTEKHNILSKEEEKKKALILKLQQDREAKLEAKRKKSQKEHYKQQVSVKSQVKKKKKPLAKTTLKVSEKVVTKTETIIPEVKIEVEEVIETSFYKRFIKWLNT